LTVLAERPQEVDAEVIQPRSRRPLVALLLAGIALAAAIVGAIGPAVHEHALYRWPPSVLPDRDPVRAWYTPLLLSNRVPASIDVSLPCVLPPPLPGASASPVVLATARNPVRAEGLSIRRVEGSLRFSVGSRRLASVSWPPPPNACPYPVRVANSALMLPGVRVRTGSSFPEGMPTVSSLFSELDVRAVRDMRVLVETRTYATSPTVRQVIASIAGALLALTALLLLVPGVVDSLRRSIIGSGRRAWAAVGAVDAVVVAFLLVWWVLSPAFGDDGWIWMRAHVFSEIGAFSNYIDSYGANVPLDYWLEWLQHWLASATDQLVLLRLPSLAALVASWFLSRWCLRRVIGAPEPPAVRWSLAAAFALLAMAWGMTLRPEPFVCLFVVANLATALSFLSNPRSAPLVMTVIVTSLALTAHPAGIVVLAPTLAISPRIVSCLRKRLISMSSCVVLLLSGTALTTVLLFLDRDVESWNADRSLFEQSEYYRQAWWWEPARYVDMLKASSWASSIRHMSVLVLFIAVLAYVTRRRSATERLMLAIPARSLGIALVLLILTPSKTAWHFGALAGVGAVAFAAECARFLGEAQSAGQRRVRPLIAIELIIAAFIWSWTIRLSWTLLDLQTMTWDRAFDAVDIGGSGVASWLLVMIAILLVAALVDHRRRRRGQVTPSDMPWQLAAWALPVCASVLIAATGVVLVIDAARATGWAPAGQNVEALVNRAGCGLGDHVRIGSGTNDGANRSARPLAASMKSARTTTLPDHLLAPYFPCANLPSIDGGVAKAPRLVITRLTLVRPIAKPESSFAGVADLYRVRRLYEGKAFRVFAVTKEVPGAEAARAERVS
jgi:Mycobacterial cell wall arabinan synthesis protein